MIEIYFGRKYSIHDTTKCLNPIDILDSPLDEQKRNNHRCPDPPLSRASWDVSRAHDCKWSSDTWLVDHNRDTWSAVIFRSRTSRASSGPCCWRNACRSARRWTVYAGERVRQWYLKSRRPSELERESKLTTRTRGHVVRLMNSSIAGWSIPFEASSSLFPCHSTSRSESFSTPWNLVHLAERSERNSIQSVLLNSSSYNNFGFHILRCTRRMHTEQKWMQRDTTKVNEIGIFERQRFVDN